MFLCKNNIHFSNIWKDFFKNNMELCNIYIHCYDPENITDKFTKQYVCDKTIKTSWGDIADALKYLLQLSVDDNNVKHIIVSESTIPIKNFKYVYNYLIKDDKSNFPYQSHLVKNSGEQGTLLMNLHRYINNCNAIPEFCKKISIKHWYWNPTWVIFNTKHANLFIKESKYYQYFKKAFGADENYPSFVLSINNQLKYVNNLKNTHVNWRERTVFPNGQIRPKTYEKLRKNDIDEFSKKDLLFARKFSIKSDIEDYIEYLWNLY